MAAIGWALLGLVAVVAVALVYAWFEAGWLRTRVLDARIAGLPEELDGVRIAHLSDFHLGAPPSRGGAATARAVRWVAGRKPDLVCVTGDLVSHPRGERRLRALLERLGGPYTVLGNHDIAITRDPFSRAAELEDLREAVLLRDESATAVVRGTSIQIVGLDPQTYRSFVVDPVTLADEAAPFRLLLCHFPSVGRRIRGGAYHLILAGHLHGGQITIPFPGRPFALAHPREPEVAGLFQTRGGLLHVSRGTGTTFVPFRFFARPEATELVLRRA